MFYIVGQRVKTEPVGTREKVLSCSRCGRPRPHREHRLVRAATLFFVPVANVVEQTVWCCEGCGTRVSDGPIRAPSEQGDTAVGRAMDFIGHAAEQAVPTLERLRHAAEEAITAATEGDASPGRPATPTPERPEEPEPAPRPSGPRKRRL